MKAVTSCTCPMCGHGACTVKGTVFDISLVTGDIYTVVAGSDDSSNYGGACFSGELSDKHNVSVGC